jgi:diadenosine tetraphosphate (Ap4A) HIT family hydrolase
VSPADCPFCAAGAASLWESEHYRVIPDAFPRCVGHVLLITRDHQPSHMHAPQARMDEFVAAQARVRDFLLAEFGAAAFYENGGARQEVPHAHLHGLPFAPELPSRWLEKGRVRPIAGWDAARAACEQEGRYFYLETAAGAFLIRDYSHVLSRVRRQLVGQTEADWDPATGKMRRGGPEMVAATAARWRQWESRYGAGGGGGSIISR